MFREIKKSGSTMESEESLEILKNGVYGVLSTVGEDGYAYGVPLNYIYDGSSVFFHCGFNGHKIDNLHFDDKVSFCVVGNNEIAPSILSMRYKSVIVFGRANEAQGEEKREALKLFIEKYTPQFRSKGMEHIENSIDGTCVYKIKVEHISGKSRHFK
jgi:nitroimidazol reductase NimA-like FMN-containing flavoprotein (pyridoxamine 5'-phosphate oxidase superfamily)